MDPGPYSLKSLVAMDQARSREAWNHTTTLCHYMHRLHARGRFPIETVNPHYRRPRGRPIDATAIQILIESWGAKPA